MLDAPVRRFPFEKIRRGSVPTAPSSPNNRRSSRSAFISGRRHVNTTRFDDNYYRCGFRSSRSMTAATVAASLSLLCVAAVVSRARGFNLDTKMPIVKRSDNPGSCFGYSVAGHQSTDEHDQTRVVDTWWATASVRLKVLEGRGWGGLANVRLDSDSRGVGEHISSNGFPVINT